MTKENHTQEDVTANMKSRALSDAEYINKGAEHNKRGELQFWPAQISDARAMMLKERDPSFAILYDRILRLGKLLEEMPEILGVDQEVHERTSLSNSDDVGVPGFYVAIDTFLEKVKREIDGAPKRSVLSWQGEQGRTRDKETVMKDASEQLKQLGRRASEVSGDGRAVMLINDLAMKLIDTPVSWRNLHVLAVETTAQLYGMAEAIRSVGRDILDASAASPGGK